jgi:hypothetical protein
MIENHYPLLKKTGLENALLTSRIDHLRNTLAALDKYTVFRKSVYMLILIFLRTIEFAL